MDTLNKGHNRNNLQIMGIPNVEFSTCIFNLERVIISPYDWSQCVHYLEVLLIIISLLEEGLGS